MGDLSPHFDSREFLCRHCRKLPRRGIVPALVSGLEVLRGKGYAARGGLYVRSGYRCAIRQAQLHAGDPGRAAKRSQHTQAAACDVDPLLLLDEVLDLDVFSGVGWQYVEGRPRVVHVDVRHASGWNPTKSSPTRPAVWQYR